MVANDQTTGIVLLAKWELFGAILKDKSLSCSAIRTAVVLLDRHQAGQDEIALVALAEAIKADQRTARRAAQQLLDRGWFRRLPASGGAGQRSTYIPAFERAREKWLEAV